MIIIALKLYRNFFFTFERVVTDFEGSKDGLMLGLFLQSHKIMISNAYQHNPL
jgi:hypothetical protein